VSINENIKLLCKETGTSFAELADRLGVTRQTLYRQSAGAVQLSTLERIAKALNVPPFVLLHPAPLSAIRQYRTGTRDQAAGDHNQAATASDPATVATFRCPICGTTFAPIHARNQDDQPEPIRATTDKATATKKRGRPRKQAGPEDDKLF